MFHPYGDPSSNETLSWGAEPRYRGTYSILSSCIITIGLCVWTAIHLNIPEHGKVVPQFWRKVKWLAVGLFAPELVAWTAFQQRREARRTCDMLRVHFNQPPLPSTLETIRRTARTFLNWATFWKQHTKQGTANIEMQDVAAGPPSRRHLFTMVHGHFIAMGGIAVDTSDAPDLFVSNYGRRRSLTVVGLNLLLRVNQDLMPNLAEEEIYDKSKANGFVKILVCLQAAWFCTQIIVRMTSHLTISILELNTFAHALCTLLIYFLWWDKPLDVTEPSLIRGEAAHPVIALLHVFDPEGFEITGHCPNYFGNNPCLKCPHKMPVVCSDYPSNTTSADGKYYQAWKYLHEVKVPLLPGFIRAVAGENFHGFALYCQRPLPQHWFAGQQVFDFPQSLLQCLELARNVPIELPEIHRRPKYLQKRIKNILLPNGGSKEDERFLWQAAMSITVAGLIYGGLHLAAWNLPMPSVPKLLWRVGSLRITLSGPTYLLWACIEVCLRRHVLLGSKLEDKWYIQLLLYLHFIYLAIPIIVYAAARIFLVVECFINVRHLPASTFEVPQWSQYFPHIS